MRLRGPPGDAVLLSSILFPLFAAAAGNIDCGRVVVDRTSFDLSELGGARSVVHSVDNGVSYTNTTYTIDVCRPLGKAKHVKPEDQCPNGTRLCAIERVISKDGESDTLGKVYPIAGELVEKGGSNMDAKWALLQNSKSNEDSTKEGLILEINGGFKKGEDGEKKRPQKAIIEFLCDKSRTGLENLPNPEDQYDEVEKREEGEAENDGTPSLEYVRYDTDGKDADVLRLRWRTNHACENDTPPGEHWGFLTWFIIIAFMSIATYLIFGSWLNYNRYGARGWDLLPHGDTIRDVPYLMKDWFRRVLNTVQGSGTRGGYAAV